MKNIETAKLVTLLFRL